MRTNNTLKMISVLSVTAVVALTGCGSDEDGNDGGADTGTLTGEEFAGHQIRDVDADGAPSVDFDIEPDPHGGWNVRINTDGFEFTPDEVNGDAAGGQGHAHIYVDDAKFARVYSEYYHLPASAVPEGEHTVMVTLNADDHSSWAVDGEAIAASATVTGAEGTGHGDHSHGAEDQSHGDDTENAQEGDDAEPTDEGDTAADHVLTYTIADGTAEPQLEQQSVEQGSTVRIEITGDVADEYHLHGYDVTAEAAAGETAVLEFTADMTGRYELETHESGLKLLDLLVE